MHLNDGTRLLLFLAKIISMEETRKQAQTALYWSGEIEDVMAGPRTRSWQSKHIESQLTVPLGLFCLPVMMSYLATPCILSEAATAGS